MSWLNLRNDPDIFWVVLKKITKNPSQNNRTSNRELEARTQGLESEALTVTNNLNKTRKLRINVILRHAGESNVTVGKQ